MSLATDLKAEQGSAILDLLGFGILLQIPILMFATVALNTQHQQLALESIARHGLRAHVLWPDQANTSRVVSELATDFGLATSALKWELSCTPDPDCLADSSMTRLQVSLGGVIAYSIQPSN